MKGESTVFTAKAPNWAKIGLLSISGLACHADVAPPVDPTRITDCGPLAETGDSTYGFDLETTPTDTGVCNFFAAQSCADVFPPDCVSFDDYRAIAMCAPHYPGDLYRCPNGYFLEFVGGVDGYFQRWWDPAGDPAGANNFGAYTGSCGTAAPCDPAAATPIEACPCEDQGG